MKTTIDSEFGTIALRYSARAKRYSLKMERGRLVAVLPVGGNIGQIHRMIADHRERIGRLLDTVKTADRLDEQTVLETLTFRTKIARTNCTNFYATLQAGWLTIACPATTDFGQDAVQEKLRMMVKSALRHEAKRVLLPRLAQLAQEHGFRYTRATVRDSHSRWGSCSSEGSISLSLSLMLLPQHLADYVLLHELCHTIEMSHNIRFWRLMDRVTGGRTRALRDEMRSYHTFE